MAERQRYTVYIGDPDEPGTLVFEETADSPSEALQQAIERQLRLAYDSMMSLGFSVRKGWTNG